jgi:molybdopterin-guanine dinucleotide biosynthesis protein B
MHAFQVCGCTGSGKTTLISNLLPWFTKNHLHVAVIKNIHSPNFQMDRPGKDTFIHHQSGADPVVARGSDETDFLFYHSMSFPDIASKINSDWLIVEGMQEFPLPRIVCGKEPKDLDAYIDDRTFLISGPYSEKRTSCRNIPAVSNVTPAGVKKIYRVIREEVFFMLPFTDCEACGMTCAELETAIIKGKKTVSDCRPPDRTATVMIGGKTIPLNPFVEKVLRNTIFGILKELRGFKQGEHVEISIGSSDKKSMKRHHNPF